MSDQNSNISLFTDPNLVDEAPIDVDSESNSSSIENHYANIADFIDDDHLNALTAQLMDDVDDDIRSHEPARRVIEVMMNELGFDRSADMADEPNPGSSGVINPVFAKAATDLSARIMGQFWPAAGPVRTEIAGQITPRKQAKSDRVRKFMCLQLTELIPGYRRQEDRMINYLTRVGTAFKKCFFNGDEVQVDFIRREDLIVPYHCESLEKAERITHCIRMSRYELQKLQKANFYRTIDLGSPSAQNTSEIDRAKDRIEGTTPPAYNRSEYELYEVHCILDIPDADTDGPLPYILTYEKDSGKILRLSRNWDIEDTNKARDEVFVDYGLLPWEGVYSLGLFHQIGGQSKAATDALRDLLDAGHLSNQLCGFRLKTSATSGTEITINPGEFAEIDSGAGATDIRQVIMSLPFAGPNTTLFELMKYVEEAAMSFANINVQTIADSTNTGPVGTTFALISEAEKVFNSIFSRLHDSKRRELKIIHQLNHRHLQDVETFKQFGGELVVSRMDFDDEIDVRPISDPNASSNVQKMAQLQTAMQMAEMPQLQGIINIREVAKRSFEIMGISNFEVLMTPTPPQPTPRGPIENVQAILNGQPVDAFPGQDTDSHIAVYLEVLQSPLFGINPLVAPLLNPALGKLILRFLSLRFGNLAKTVVTAYIPQYNSNDNDMQQQNVVAQILARDAGHLLAADQMLATKMIPIVQKAMQFVPPPPQDPLTVSAQAEADKVKADQRKDLMNIAVDAAKIQSTERVAEMETNQKTDQAVINALKVAQPPTPTAFTPEGQLPNDVPDPIQGLAKQIWQLIQTMQTSAQSTAPMPQAPQTAPMPTAPGEIVPNDPARAALENAMLKNSQ